MATQPATLGVAVLGLGVGEQHARAYVEAGCELRWLHDLDSARSRGLVKAIGHGRVAESYEQILADRDTDLVSIATYDDAHACQVASALDAGKHVFVEKPLCRSPEELAAIRRAWERSRGLHLASNLVLRGAPLYQWLGGRVASGSFGRIYSIDGEYLYGRIEKITLGWRKDVENYSAIQGGGVHVVDLMLAVAGERPITVTAVGNRICTEGTAFRYRDFIAATYEFPSGIVGRLVANLGCVHPHQHVLRVYGTASTFLHDDAGPRLHASRDPSRVAEAVPHAPLPATKGVLIPGFVRGILEDRDPRLAAEREFGVVSVCFAADRALATGERVTIDGEAE